MVANLKKVLAFHLKLLQRSTNSNNFPSIYFFQKIQQLNVVAEALAVIVLAAGQGIVARVLRVQMIIQDAGECAVWANNAVLIFLSPKTI